MAVIETPAGKPESLFRRYARKRREYYYFRLTIPGWTVLGGWGVSTSLGVYSIEMPIYLLVCAWTAFGVVALGVGWLWRPRVRLSGAPATKAIAGRPVRAVFHAVNTTGRNIYDLAIGVFGLPGELHLEDQDASVDCLPPGEGRELTLTITPKRRGLYPMPRVRAYSLFPFALCRTPAAQMTAPPLLVLPSFQPAAHIDVPMGTRYQPGGVVLTSNVGESPEYIGNREYHPGDPLRHIDFRSWARLAAPVVREFQEEYYNRVAVVLDTFVPGRKRPPAEGFPALEAAISLGATVSDGLSRGEYLIDLFAAGPELYVFRAGRHTAHLENIMEILACVDACRKDPFEVVAPALADELNAISTIVCIFLDWDKSRELLVRTAAEAGCSVKLFIVREGETSRPLAEAEAWTADVTQLTPAAVREGAWERL